MLQSTMDDKAFGVTKAQLSELMALRKKEGFDGLKELNGVEAVMENLHTNPHTGISDNGDEVKRRQAVFGRNAIEADPPKHFVALALEALGDKVLLILMGAAIVEIVLGLTVSEHKDTAWVEGAAILVAVAVVVLVTAFNDWTKERQFKGLQKKLESTQRYTFAQSVTIRHVRSPQSMHTCVHARAYHNAYHYIIM